VNAALNTEEMYKAEISNGRASAVRDPRDRQLSHLTLNRRSWGGRLRAVLGGAEEQVLCLPTSAQIYKTSIERISVYSLPYSLAAFSRLHAPVVLH
jgi:hypothetical protein